MTAQSDLLSRTKPLADPVRVIIILIVVGGAVFAAVQVAAILVVAAVASQRAQAMAAQHQSADAVRAMGGMAFTAGIEGILIALGLGAALLSFAFLTGVWGKPNAIYLRAFRTDKATAKLRDELVAILGPGFRLSGIRPPTKKTSMFFRFLAPGLVALRYAGSTFMELEAGDDWMARLWKTYQNTRLVFIDVRDITVHVHNEIQMTLETMGIERCIFVVDSSKTVEQWRETIAAIAGPDQDPARFQLLNADPERIKNRQLHADLKTILKSLPPGVFGEIDRGRQFILEHVSEEQLRMSRRTSPMVVLTSAAGLVLSVSLGLLPQKLQIVLLPIALLTMLFVVRAFFRAIGRIWRLARAGHRGAAVKDSFLLAVPLLPLFAVLLLILIAIPTLARARQTAEGQSAINSLQTIKAAELQYSAAYPEQGYACRLSALAGNPQNGTPTADAAGLIQDDLASGRKSGYLFTFVDCSRATIQGHQTVTDFRIVATPDEGLGSGRRGFCMDASGNILVDPNGGTSCTEPLQ
jgi:type IV pilus assembly protein PilA